MENKFKIDEKVYVKDATSDQDNRCSGIIKYFYEKTTIETTVDSSGETSSEATVQYFYQLDRYIRAVSEDPMEDSADYTDTFEEHRLLSVLNNLRKHELEAKITEVGRRHYDLCKKLQAMRTLNMDITEVENEKLKLSEEYKKLEREIDSL